MARTQVPGRQVLDASINKDDIDIITTGKALITRILQGSGIVIDSSTGVDSGTGDVTISSTGGGLFGDDLHSVLSEGESYTTGSTWVTKAELNVTGLVPGGDYILFGNYNFTVANFNFPIYLRMIIDDTTEVFVTNYVLARANYWEQKSGFVIYEDIVGSSHNIKLQFHSTDGKSVGLRRARIILWRIS